MNKSFQLLILSVFLAISTPSWSDSTWINKQYSISGDWSIENTDAGQFFVLGDNFKTKAGPDLKLFLIKKSLNAVKNKEALHETGRFVADLQSTSGSQRFQISDDINLEDYKSLAVHCQQYSVVWGGVSLP